jgi:hypothetical protein
MLSLEAIPIVFKSGDTRRIPENPNPVKGRAFAAEVDPRVKPGAPAAVPCLLFSQEVKTA